MGRIVKESKAIAVMMENVPGLALRESRFSMNSLPC